jgi:hypothetical protein
MVKNIILKTDLKTDSQTDSKIINIDMENLNFVKFKDLGEKFRKKLKLHKMFINQLMKTKNEKIIPAIISSGEELALIYADFKCEKCGNEKYLQFHHLIQRNVRGYIDDSKYLSQRYYWHNIAILCNKCHGEFHGFNMDKFLKDSLCISNEKINKLKELYKINNLEINN